VTDVTVKVYLNESRDSFAGFVNKFSPAQLRKAIEFDVALPTGPDQAHRQVDALLEIVFAQLNIGGDLIPATPWTVVYREYRNRSLSVGDVVVVGESAYSCESAGWKSISTDALTAALIDNTDSVR
jgi:hypothetical protein